MTFSQPCYLACFYYLKDRYHDLFTLPKQRLSAPLYRQLLHLPKLVSELRALRLLDLTPYAPADRKPTLPEMRVAVRAFLSTLTNAQI